MNTYQIALVGNPNCGKTALFNRLTGARQKVANYAGVTVERKEGHFIAPSGRTIRVLDLPGAYSLEAASPDEAITRAVCRGELDEAQPDLLVCVVDATNLRLHLRFVAELRRLGRPMLVALNMMDTARRRDIRIDVAALERELDMPVVETVAVTHGGAASLIERLDRDGLPPPPAPDPSDAGDLNSAHAAARRAIAAAVTMPARREQAVDAIDRVVLHPVLGLLILAAVMFLIFQAVYSWAEPLMDGIEALFGWLGEQASEHLPDGMLQSLVADGIIAGIGGVIVFLPQILILFLFILALEESGYLPRAAFLLDRLMFKAGLTGRAFIPLLSSFACAIPGIMATRSIADPRDRLTTILVAPLMTCSARLPVYALLIGAFIPAREVGPFNLQGLVLFGLYLAGIVSALAVAAVIKRLNKDRSEHVLMMELPAYRVPHLFDLAIGLWERGMIFLRRVGGIILALTILLWFLSSFPAPPDGSTHPAIEYSFAGRLGALLEHVFAPIGFNWQICIALVPGLAAREVAVSSLATVYALSGNEDALSAIVAAQWSMATAFSLLAWYVFAPMCLSTLATVRRETNSWRQVWIMAGYLFALAYVASFLTYRIALWLA